MWHYQAKLVRVIDGDTVDLMIDLGFYHYVKVRVRLEGIDTPERGQDGWSEATQFVVEWFARYNGECEVVTEKTGKYGRWLGTIKHDDDLDAGVYVILNEQLVKEGLAVVYGT